MSTSPSPPAPRKPPSAASRYLFLFLLGLVIGIVSVVMVLRALDARRTWQDNYPEATMHLLQAQTTQLSDAAKANRCAATDTLPRLQAMRMLGNDLEPAFPELRDDERFVGHAGKFRESIDTALASPPLNCAGVTAVLKDVGEACKACHQDFRG